MKGEVEPEVEQEEDKKTERVNETQSEELFDQLPREATPDHLNMS